MNYYFLKEVFNNKNRDKIFEAIDYMNNKWSEYIANDSSHNIVSREWSLVQNTILNNVIGKKELTKYIIVYTGLAYLYDIDLGFCKTENDKQNMKKVLKSLKGIFSEIDSEVRNFEKEWGYLLEK